MTSQIVKEILDSCFTAKKILSLLPPLPQGMRPRHIDVIDAVFALERRQNSVRVSEVSRALRLTAPSVTKLINELRALGVLAKTDDPADRRATLVRLTESGRAIYDEHVARFHLKLAEAFSEIDAADRRAMTKTIQKVYAQTKKVLDARDVHAEKEGEPNGRSLEKD